MRRFEVGILVCMCACQFEPSVDVGIDGSAVDIDADPNAPDADSDARVPMRGVEQVSVDPLGDGTAAATMAAFANHVYVGPSQNGSSLMRFSFSNSMEVVSPTYSKDTNGNQHENTLVGTFTSIGYVGCTPDNDCGPDNEDGRAILASGTIVGTEWLILGAAKSAGDLDYIYMTDNGSLAPEFSYMDLSALLGGQTRGTSAVLISQDHIYAGFPDTGGSQPYLIDMFVTASAPGLDAVDGTDAQDLDAKSMFNLSTGGTSIIDVIARFNDRPYIANDGDWVKGPMFPPQPFPDDSANWQRSTPTASAYTSKASVATAKSQDILPSDRAVPNMVVYDGTLYAARNTVDGPQLWVCIPQGVVCDPSDWVLAAPNTEGDTQLTQFNRAGNESISLLESTGQSLYIGFDNPNVGTIVYTTSATGTLTIDSFVGDGDCSAGPSCPGLGGNGFGDDTNILVFDSEVVDIGASRIAVYALVGNGTDPIELYRIVD